MKTTSNLMMILQFYIVCDGVGGNNAGEVASCLACEAVYMYIEAHLEVIEQFLAKVTVR